ARAELRLDVPRVARQLGHALPHLGVQQAQQALDPDLLGVRSAAPLTVERPEVADDGVTPHGRTSLPGEGEHVRQDARVVVHGVVGVHVGRAVPGELLETRHLALALDGHFVRVAGVQLQVEADAQTGVLARESGRVDARRPVHEQARARQDPVAVRLDDAAIDAAARTEVVPVDDEPLHGPTSTAGWNTGRPTAARSTAA